ncbi:MAG: alpha-amylase family glycosyl hydrolase, partial [Planctomycetota bacterium]
LAAFALPAAPAAAEVVQDDRGVTFRFDTGTMTDKPRSIHVAGSFNGWNAGGLAMTDDDGDGVWEASVDLPRGQIGYKFVVNGNVWLTDPTDDATLREPDGHGGFNSGAIIGPDIRNAPPPVADGINFDFVVHNPTLDVVSQENGRALFTLRTQAGDVERASLVVFREVGSSATNSFELRKLSTAGGLDVWQGVGFGEPSDEDTQTLTYFFEIQSGSATGLVTENFAAVIEEEPTELPEFFTAKVFNIDVPEWAKHAVWYQVFPERFRNGNPDNDPGLFWYENATAWNSDWWQDQPGETPGAENFYNGAGDVWNRRYGGDIQGLRDALPYLKELGVNAIYLNPVFEAESMHKYDAADFRHIDDNFGVLWTGYGVEPGTTNAKKANNTGHDGPIANYPPMFEGETDDPATWVWSPSDKVFLAFLEEAHAQGFKVIIDGVFNHVGRA